MRPLTLYCFRDHDLRLADNPALCKAIDYANLANNPLVLCLFIDKPSPSELAAIDVARYKAIEYLDQSIQALGGHLNIFLTSTQQTLSQLTQQYNIDGVFWNRRYSQQAIATDTQLKQYLSANDIACMSKNSTLLFEPFDARTLKSDATPYKVYTPFSKKLLDELKHITRPLPAPLTLTQTIHLNKVAMNTSFNALATQPNWAARLYSYWTLNEQQAHIRIEQWQANIHRYHETRNLPDLEAGTSKLSPYLRLGLCSPKQVLYGLINQPLTKLDEGQITYLKEILWREYAYYVLYHFPDTLERPFKQKFMNFPWRQPDDNDANLQAWRLGKTGIPIVDAGMRELWATGWMHNRVRMIVASWLTKNMSVHWRIGANWFMHTLIDADLASNTMGWQWVAGCGVDAAPYFRIFNPTLQAKKFDPKATYIKKWLPELRDMPVKHCFEPWQHNSNIAAPIIDINDSRLQALDKYKKCANHL